MSRRGILKKVAMTINPIKRALARTTPISKSSDSGKSELSTAVSKSFPSQRPNDKTANLGKSVGAPLYEKVQKMTDEDIENKSGEYLDGDEGSKRNGIGRSVDRYA